MPNVLIKSIKQVTRENKSGKTYTGLEIEGTQLVDKNNFSEKDWSKFVPDFTGESAFFEGFSSGDRVKIQNKRDGQFWKIVSVTALQDYNSQPSSDGDKSSSQKSKASKGSGNYREPDVITRTEAIRLSIMHVGNLLGANDKYKSLFKATITPELIQEMLLQTAATFTGFINGTAVKGTAANTNTDDLQDQSDGNQSSVSSGSVEDDIPF